MSKSVGRAVAPKVAVVPCTSGSRVLSAVCLSGMKTRRENVSEDDGLGETIRRNMRSKNSAMIPIDLIIEIFLRLSSKSIAKCHCVSKLFASIICSPDFTDLFMSRSLARPQLLFACQNMGDVFFFSAPQPQNPNENSSSITASYHMKVTFNIPYHCISDVNGLLLRRDQWLEGSGNEVLVGSICNPSTGQSITLPKINKNMTSWVYSFFGYDPIDKQFKVLSMTSTPPYRLFIREHQVLTLGTGKPSWRIIECCIQYDVLRNGTCINGVLYYGATVTGKFPLIYMIVCFDVRSEKFKFIYLPEAFVIPVCHGTLVNFNGKLGSLRVERDIGGTYRSLELLVLEDAEKEEWSEHTYLLSDACLNVVGTTILHCVGMTRTNEIVLSSLHHTMPFYVLYYNIVRKTMTRIEIQGIDASKYHKIDTFIDHIEDVKLM